LKQKQSVAVFCPEECGNPPRFRQEQCHAPSTQAISPPRQRMIDHMRMRKQSPKTQSHYLRAVRQFAGYLGRSPDTATVEDLRFYQLHLVDHGTSPVPLNAAITRLKFFFAITADQAGLIARMQPVRVPRTLPVCSAEVPRLIIAAGNLKHQTALSVAYGAELRISEVVSVRVSDIHSKRMTLRIEQSKDHEDRYAMLPPVRHLPRRHINMRKRMSNFSYSCIIVPVRNHSSKENIRFAAHFHAGMQHPCLAPSV
jgi:integrase